MDVETLRERLAGLKPSDSSDLRPWLRAAAVLDTFDPAKLKPYGNTKEAAAPAALLDRSDRLVTGGYRLRDGVRTEQLVWLQQYGELLDARRVNEAAPTTRQRFLDEWLAGEEVAWADLEAPQLRAALQVLRWIEPLPLPKKPHALELENRLRHVERREPLKRMVADFRDRSSQMKRLQQYLEQGGPPWIVCGIGGSGKTALIARFLLDLEGEGKDVWVYLDMNDEAFDPQRPTSLLEGIVEQLSEQRPATTRLARIVMERMQAADAKSGLSARQWLDSNILRLLESLLPEALGDDRLVVVVDTFEAAQADGPAIEDELVGVARRFVELHPGVRFILSGRTPIQGLTSVKMDGLPKRDAMSLLRRRIESKQASRALIEAVIERTGRLPLTIRLAADAVNSVLKQNATPVELLRDLEQLDNAIQEKQVQGFLYMRLLSHLRPDQNLRLLAHASLALPAFDARLLSEVVAPHCGVSADRAAELAESLLNEVAFVEPLTAGKQWMRHRADLRERVQPYLERSLASARIRPTELLTEAKEHVEQRQQEVGPRVLALYAGGAAPTAPRPDVLGRARRELNSGQPQAAIEVLRKSPKIKRSPEGRFVLAQACWELGKTEECEENFRLAVEAALKSGRIDFASEIAAWGADHLDVTEEAERVLSADADGDTLHRLKVVAAVEASRYRTVSNWRPSDRLLESWRRMNEAERAGSPELLGRLAGLVGRVEESALLEALNAVGLPRLSMDETEQLAKGLLNWYSALAKGESKRSPLAQYVDLSAKEAGSLKAWRRVVQSQAGVDAASFLLRLMITLDVPAEFHVVVSDIYLRRDCERFQPSEPSTEMDLSVGPLQVPTKLSRKQRKAVHEVIVDAFNPQELHRLVAGLGQKIDFRLQGSLQELSFNIVTQAEKHGQLSDLLTAMIQERPSAGVDRLIREALRQ